MSQETQRSPGLTTVTVRVSVEKRSHAGAFYLHPQRMDSCAQHTPVERRPPAAAKRPAQPGRLEKLVRYSPRSSTTRHILAQGSINNKRDAADVTVLRRLKGPASDRRYAPQPAERCLDSQRRRELLRLLRSRRGEEKLTKRANNREERVGLHAVSAFRVPFDSLRLYALG